MSNLSGHRDLRENPVSIEPGVFHPAPRHTVAIDELCRVLNDTHTVYPGTGFTLRYSIKSHR